MPSGANQGKWQEEVPQFIEYHEEGRRIQDGECVCDTWRRKVPLKEVKLCPTWEANEVKCPDFRFMLLLPSYRARAIGTLHPKDNRFDLHSRRDLWRDVQQLMDTY